MTDATGWTTCPECTYPYPGACENPMCLANPTLSDAARDSIVARRDAYRAEQAERERMARLREQSFTRRAPTA